MIALICMLLTLVFIIVALVGTWYSVSGEINGEEGYTNYGLTSYETKNPGQDTETQSYADDKKDYEDAGMDVPGWIGVYDTTFYITIIALIITIIALICILGMTFSFGNLKTMKMLGGLFGILVVIFCLVAPIYFMTALPAEMSKDSTEDLGFWDEIDVLGTKISFGPGYAWYLMIIGFVFSLIASIVVFMDKSNPVMTPPQ